MYFKASTLDDLLRRVIDRLISTKSERNRYSIGPKKGPAVELVGVCMKLTNPRARLSRTASRGMVFSSLGELAWYLSKTNNLEQIRYYINRYGDYSDDNVTLYGGYGPRLFAYKERNLFQEIRKMLDDHPQSRQALLPIFSPEDLGVKTKDLPCTSSLQFFVRKRRLHMTVYMRSNDVFLGMPPDVFCFTMLQELMARSLGLELGNYTHMVGSLHLYEVDRHKAKDYLEEGWQPTNLSMPAMPLGEPWVAVEHFLKAEEQIRLGQIDQAGIFSGSHSYWLDLIKLLLIFRHGKAAIKGVSAIKELMHSMHSKVYETYIRKRMNVLPQNVVLKEQLPLTPERPTIE